MRSWIERQFLSEVDTITFCDPGLPAPVEQLERPVVEIGAWKTAAAYSIDWSQINSAVDVVLARCRVQSPKV